MDKLLKLTGLQNKTKDMTLRKRFVGRKTDWEDWKKKVYSAPLRSHRLDKEEQVRQGINLQLNSLSEFLRQTPYYLSY